MFSYIQLLKIFIDIEIEWMYEQENPIGKRPPLLVPTLFQTPQKYNI